MSQKSVLIAEDDVPVMIGLREILEEAGWDVTVASDGNQALARYRQKPADIVLTDLLMPRLDGIGLLQELRSEHPDVPVVVLTGFGTVDRCRDALRAGATDFLQKPCDEMSLLKVLDRAYGRITELRLLDDAGRSSSHAFSIEVPADIARRTAVTAQLLAVSDAAGFRARRWELRLAFDEAFTNAVIHGAMSRPDLAIRIEAAFQGDEGTVTVVDPGPGFDPSAVADTIRDSPGGRGLFLIRSFCDKAEWPGKGNVCRMTFRRRKVTREPVPGTPLRS